jgi:hypothetical protein
MRDFDLEDYGVRGISIADRSAHRGTACPMASWVVKCKNCEVEFTHSTIADDHTMMSYVWPSKPDFPEGGSPLECPTCGQRATYQETNLTYRA